MFLVTVEGHIDTDRRGDGVIGSESSLTGRACALSGLWGHHEDLGGARDRQTAVCPAFIPTPKKGKD